MAIRFLRTDGDEVLRRKALQVKRFDAALGRLLDDMVESMHHYEGIGLAAPQIGVSKQLVVIQIPEGELLELVNPEIVASSGEEIDVEGCLSVPETYGEVERCTNVTVVARNRRGEEVQLEAEGLLARALQHEIDHLQGILFTDKALRIVEPEAADSEEDSE